MAGERPEHVVLLEAFRTHLTRIPQIEEQVHRTEALLKMAFETTKKVTTHRFTLGSPDQLAQLDDLFREAADTVGPGTRDLNG